jgi:hypothetical protein
LTPYIVGHLADLVAASVETSLKRDDDLAPHVPARLDSEQGEVEYALTRAEWENR